MWVIINHMNDDRNAPAHATYGLIAFIIGFVLGKLYGLDNEMSALLGAACALGIGILIEVIQRVQRSGIFGKGLYLGLSGTHQNTTLESVLDVFQTWWFPLTYLVRYHSGKNVLPTKMW